MNWHGQSHQDVENYMRSFDYKMFYRKKNTWKFSKVSQLEDRDLLILPVERLSDFTWCCESE